MEKSSLQFDIKVGKLNTTFQHTALLLLMVVFLLNQLAKKNAATIVEQLHGIESEAKALRSMTQRMVLTQHEMVSHSDCIKSFIGLLFSCC